MLDDPLTRERRKYRNNQAISLYENPLPISEQDKEIDNSEERNSEMERLADRALLLLSFKETSTPNLRYIMKVLGIQTLDEKKIVLQIIYELIRDGIVYIPRFEYLQLCFSALANPNLDWSNAEEVESIDVCLLKPYDQILNELQIQIMQLQEQIYGKKQ